MFEVIIPFYMLHLVPALIGCSIFWYLGHKRGIVWFKWEYLVLVLPWVIWAFSPVLFSIGKSLSNAFIEGIALAICAPLSPIIRIIFRDKPNQKLIAVCSLAFVCVAAILLVVIVPTLGE